MADKQLAPAFYSSAKRSFFALYEFLVSECGYKLVYRSGDWTAPGDALVTDDGFIIETPDGGPFRQQFSVGLNTVDARFTVTHAPWVGVAGGWNPGGGTFDEPRSGPESFYVASGTHKMSVIANARRFIVVAWWTPAVLSASDLTFSAATKKIHRNSAYDFKANGYIPGALVAVTGSASNNQLFAVDEAGVLTDEILTTGAPALVDEGPGSAVLTPRQVATLLYVGGLDGVHAGDARPAAVRAGLFGHGIEPVQAGGQYQSYHLYFTTPWRRIHADVSGGYVKLIDGWVEAPSADGLPDILVDQPSWDGSYTPLGAPLCFKETVGQPRKELPAGLLDGVFMGPASLATNMTRIGANNELLVRDGLAVLWPLGVAP